MSSNLKPDTKEKQATQMPITDTTKAVTQMPITETTNTNATPMLQAAKPDASNMSGKTDEFIKNLFQTVQGVKYDDRCPHGLPYYACMSCSH